MGKKRGRVGGGGGRKEEEVRGGGEDGKRKRSCNRAVKLFYPRSICTAENRSLYSARLYRAVSGMKVTVVFCLCREHPQYTKVATVMLLFLMSGDELPAYASIVTGS